MLKRRRSIWWLENHQQECYVSSEGKRKPPKLGEEQSKTPAHVMSATTGGCRLHGHCLTHSSCVSDDKAQTGCVPVLVETAKLSAEWRSLLQRASGRIGRRERQWDASHFTWFPLVLLLSVAYCFRNSGSMLTLAK